MLNKNKSFSYSVGPIILVLLASTILSNVTYAQLSPQGQSNSTNTSMQTSQPRVHLVKITYPLKGQQIPVSKDLLISGTSADNATNPNCDVSVIVNGIRPYHQTTPVGSQGQYDYSKWNFTLTPQYTSIKEGQNKITAKFSCANNSLLVSHSSVNVTGVPTTFGQQQISSTTTPPSLTATTLGSNYTTADTPGSISVPSEVTSATLSNNNVNSINNLGTLSVSLHLAKTSLHPGDKQTISVKVTDKNSSTAIAGAYVSGKITTSAGLLKKIGGTTNDKGTASYSWKVNNEYSSGTYKVKIDVSSTGYQKYTTSKTFKVTPYPVTTYSHYILHPYPSTIIRSYSDYHYILHPYPSTIIRSYSENTDTNTNTETTSTDTETTNTNNDHHQSVAIPPGKDTRSTDTNTNTDTETTNTNNAHHGGVSSVGGSASLGINDGGPAQKIIDSVKNKLAANGISFPP